MSPQHLDDDDRARTRAERAVALTALALTGDRPDACPDPQDIAAWHEQRLAAARARHVEMHVAACNRCFALWRDLLAIEAADPRRREQRDRWWAPIVSAARQPAWLGAAAASLAVVVIVGVYVTLQVPGTYGAALPAYELSLQGRAMLRGSDRVEGNAPVLFESGTRFELVLRPERAVGDEVTARVWYEHSGATHELSATPTLAARGVVVIAGQIGNEWMLPQGDADLLVVVGRPQALPERAALSRRLRDSRTLETNDWVAWRVPVRVGD